MRRWKIRSIIVFFVLSSPLGLWGESATGASLLANAGADAVFEVAGEDRRVDLAEAQRLESAGYRLLKMGGVQGGQARYVFYREISELEGVVPDVVIEMVRGRDPGAEKVRDEAFVPEFTYEALNGDRIRAVDLRGKVVVLSYWFIACAPCVHEMPFLNQVVSRYDERGDVVFLAPTFDSAEALTSFLKEKTFDYRVVRGAQNDFRALGVRGYPTHAVLGRDGAMVGTLHGFGDGAMLESRLGALIDRALGE